MPLTPFQTAIFRVISSHRNPDSYVAGGIVLNREESSPRFSDDIDLFHDTTKALEESATRDAAALIEDGYSVKFTKKEPTFHRAEVSRGDEGVRLEWAQDSAFRYFPLVSDPVLGFRLHHADAATNKVLAAAARQKVRDYIDLLEIDRTYMPLGAVIWAAVAKDEGWTPELVMGELRRNNKINPTTIGDVMFANQQDAVKLKMEWLDCFARAEALMATFPPATFASLFLDARGKPVRGERYDPSWITHRGSVKGAWPVIAERD